MKDVKEMAVLDIHSFLDTSLDHIPIIDVRSPSEFAQGHIPGAYSIPLFSDDERSQIGTLYKKKGSLQAVRKGLELVGPRIAFFADQLLEIAHNHKTDCIRILCWRGGMRSESMAWLASRVELSTFRLEGGYKSYRRYVLEEINIFRKVIVIGGYTGSGKTEVIRDMITKKLYPVLDLEGIAHHNGSAFGELPNRIPITQEQFENEIACRISRFPIDIPYIIEDESRIIGKLVIPTGIWDSMREPFSIIHMCPPKEERIQRIIRDYGGYPIHWLTSCIEKIAKKRGNQQTKEAIELLHKGDIGACVASLLMYYDQAYQKSLEKRQLVDSHICKKCLSSDELYNLLRELYTLP